MWTCDEAAAERLADLVAGVAIESEALDRDAYGRVAFADYRRFPPRACAPYRARTKGKDERGVGYVKGNAIAGHAFPSWTALEGNPPPGAACSG